MADIKLPYENPKWIYNGTDPDLIEPVDADVTNRAPKQVQDNVVKLKDISENQLDTINAITGIDIVEYNSNNNYPKGSIIKHNDIKWISIKVDSDGNNKGNEPSDDSDFWDKFKGIKSKVILKDEDPTSDDKEEQFTWWINTETDKLWNQISEDSENPDWHNVGGASGSSESQKVYDLWTKVADGGETELEFDHIQNYIAVFLNGSLLVEGDDKDYTDDDNSKITLANELQENDIVQVFIYKEVGGSGGSGLTKVWVDDDADVTIPSRTFVDTSDKEITLTLPSDPNDEDLVFVGDGKNNAQDKPVTIKPNGKNINDKSDDLTADVNGFYIGLVFKTDSWYVLNTNS